MPAPLARLLLWRGQVSVIRCIVTSRAMAAQVFAALARDAHIKILLASFRLPPLFVLVVVVVGVVWGNEHRTCYHLPVHDFKRI